MEPTFIQILTHSERHRYYSALIVSTVNGADTLRKKVGMNCINNKSITDKYVQNCAQPNLKFRQLPPHHIVNEHKNQRRILAIRDKMFGVDDD